jgi:hypothetical protein
MTGRGKSAALALYRGILRAHRKMPSEMRLLGDTYVRSEFKLHKPVTDGAQLDGFFVAWEEYLNQMMTTARRRGAVETGVLESNESVEEDGFGQQLPLDLELSEEQKTQLEKLREEATRGGKSP